MIEKLKHPEYNAFVSHSDLCKVIDKLNEVIEYMDKIEILNAECGELGDKR